MTEEEQFLKLLNNFLSCAEEAMAMLESDLEDIENPRIHTNASKQQTVERMRLVNSALFSGEKAKDGLQTSMTRQRKRKK